MRLRNSEAYFSLLGLLPNPAAALFSVVVVVVVVVVVALVAVVAVAVVSAAGTLLEEAVLADATTGGAE